STLEWLAFYPCDRQAGNSDRMASARIPTLLEVEESPCPGPAFRVEGSSRTDSPNEPRQPSMGRAAHSWGTPEARIRACSIGGREVHGPPSETAPANVAHIPRQSCQELGFF